MRRSTQSSMPKIFFVAYRLPNGEMHLAFRSAASTNRTEVIAEIDSAEKYNAMEPAALLDLQAPIGVWAQHLLPFLETSKDFKLSSKINAAIQCDYFCALDRFINPRVNPLSTNFFQISPESLLSELELEILGDLVLNGEKAILEFCLNQLSDTQLKQVFNSETKIKAADYSARKYEYTLLQLGIAAGDVSFNENNDGIVEMMLDYLKRHDPENAQAILTVQALALFDESLRDYLHKQEKEIDQLRELLNDKSQATDPQKDKIDEKIQEAQARVCTYTAAIVDKALVNTLLAADSKNLNTLLTKNSKDLNLDTLLTAHSQAQKDYCFNGFDAVVAKIENASRADIHAVLDDPTIDSPLSNALKQFRKAFKKHTHSEKIVNREHLLKIYELYDAFYLRVGNADVNHQKCEFFWDYFVEEVQRGFAACDAQIFTNPGFYNAVENRKPNMRSFNSVGRSVFFPLLFDPHYKFAWLQLRQVGLGSGGLLGAVQTRRETSGAEYFSKLISRKNIKLGELMQHSKAHSPSSLCA